MTQSHPTSLIIFGATGDVMAKKLVPALFYLFEEGRLPTNFSVIGVARRPMSIAVFHEFIENAILKNVREVNDQRAVDKFLDIFTYEQIQFDSEGDYQRLAEALNQHDRVRGKTNRLLYLAVPPELFPVIYEKEGFREIVKSGSLGGFTTRVIIEKPFGTNLESANVLEGGLAACFSQKQIYRVDHYLAKDILQSLIDFRFKNNLLEHNWNAEGIESIRIRLFETLGVESRGNFYDQTGAFRDVGQNHMLEMLALVTMDDPRDFSAEAIRAKRTEILKHIHIPSEEEVVKTTFRAQHEGYLDIPGVNPASDTETFFSVLLSIDTPRWKNVPIILEAGKRMTEQRKEILVTFRKPHENSIVFRLEPQEEVVIRFITKKRGIFETGVETRKFRFSLHEGETRTQHIAGYAKMIADAIAGDQKLFLGADEVRATWAFTDAILSAWKKNLVPLVTYTPSTDEVISAAEKKLMVNNDC